MSNPINTAEDPLLIDSDDDDEPPILVDLNAPNSSLTSGVVNDDDGEEEAKPVLPPCPVTILSGFLGSGKTTLIQYILNSPDHGKRIAVIENEYGEGLAVESVIARDGLGDNNKLQDLIELPNGCICCTVKDSLVSTLEMLLDKQQYLDYILIEASGMANPGPIASVFWLDDALESRLQLDGIVTLVDSSRILEQLTTTEEAAQQIAYADRLLINKVDLLQSKDGALEQVETALRQLHPTAPTLKTTYSKVPNLDWILNSNCFGGIDRISELDTVWQDAQEAEQESPSEHHHHHHSHSHDHDSSEPCALCPPKHRHTAGVSTIALKKIGSVNLSKLNSWLADILWPNQDAEDTVLTAMLHDSSAAVKLPQDNKRVIFRIKGIVSVEGSPDGDEDDKAHYDASTGWDQRRFIVQAVHDLWEVHPASKNLEWTASEERMCKLVVIGKHVKEDALRKGFDACFT
jgi:G3E family GTPase